MSVYDYAFPQFTLEYLRDGIVIYENFSFWFDAFIIGTILAYLFSWGSEQAKLGKDEKQAKFLGNFIGWVVAFIVTGGIHRNNHNLFELYPLLLLILFVLLGLVMWRVIESYLGRENRIASILTASAISLFLFGWALSSDLGIQGAYGEPVNNLLLGAISLLHLILAFAGVAGIIWLLGRFANRSGGGSSPSGPDPAPLTDEQKAAVQTFKTALKNINHDFTNAGSGLDDSVKSLTDAGTFFGELKENLGNLKENLSSVGAEVERYEELPSELTVDLNNWSGQVQKGNNASVSHLNTVAASLEHSKDMLDSLSGTIVDFTDQEKELTKQLTSTSKFLRDLYAFLSKISDTTVKETMTARWKVLAEEIKSLEAKRDELRKHNADILALKEDVKLLDITHEKELFERLRDEINTLLTKLRDLLQKTARESGKNKNKIRGNLTSGQETTQESITKIDDILYAFNDTAGLFHVINDRLNDLRTKSEGAYQAINDFENKVKEIIDTAQSIEKESSTVAASKTKYASPGSKLIDELKAQKDLLNTFFNDLTVLVSEFNSKIQSASWNDDKKERKVRDLTEFLAKLEEEKNKMNVEESFGKKIALESLKLIKEFKGHPSLQTTISELKYLQSSQIKYFKTFQKSIDSVASVITSNLSKTRVEWKRELRPLLDDLTKQLAKIDSFKKKLDELHVVISKEIK